MRIRWKLINLALNFFFSKYRWRKWSRRIIWTLFRFSVIFLKCKIDWLNLSNFVSITFPSYVYYFVDLWMFYLVCVFSPCSIYNRFVISVFFRRLHQIQCKMWNDLRRSIFHHEMLWITNNWSNCERQPNETLGVKCDFHVVFNSIFCGAGSHIYMWMRQF